MTPSPGTTLTPDQAIAAFEAAEATLNNDTAALAAAQAKADAANANLQQVQAAVATDQAAYVLAAKNLDAALQPIIAPPASSASSSTPAAS